jgi:hypothetical protein
MIVAKGRANLLVNFLLSPQARTYCKLNILHLFRQCKTFSLSHHRCILQKSSKSASFQQQHHNELTVSVCIQSCFLIGAVFFIADLSGLLAAGGTVTVDEDKPKRARRMRRLLTFDHILNTDQSTGKASDDQNLDSKATYQVPSSPPVSA